MPPGNRSRIFETRRNLQSHIILRFCYFGNKFFWRFNVDPVDFKYDITYTEQRLQSKTLLIFHWIKIRKLTCLSIIPPAKILATTKFPFSSTSTVKPKGSLGLFLSPITRIASAVIVVPLGNKSIESISAKGARSGDVGYSYRSAMLSWELTNARKCGFLRMRFNSFASNFRDCSQSRVISLNKHTFPVDTGSRNCKRSSRRSCACNKNKHYWAMSVYVVVTLT